MPAPDRTPIILACLHDLLLERDGQDALDLAGAVALAIDHPAVADLWPPTGGDEVDARHLADQCSRDDLEQSVFQTRATEVACARRLADVAAALSLRGAAWADDARLLWDAASRLLGLQDERKSTAPAADARDARDDASAPTASIGQTVRAEDVPPGAVVTWADHPANVRWFVRLLSGGGWEIGDGAEDMRYGWLWNQAEVEVATIRALGLTDPEARKVASMTAEETQAWCSERLKDARDVATSDRIKRRQALCLDLRAKTVSLVATSSDDILDLSDGECRDLEERHGLTWPRSPAAPSPINKSESFRVGDEIDADLAPPGSVVVGLPAPLGMITVHRRDGRGWHCTGFPASLSASAPWHWTRQSAGCRMFERCRILALDLTADEEAAVSDLNSSEAARWCKQRHEASRKQTAPRCAHRPDGDRAPCDFCCQFGGTR